MSVSRHRCVYRNAPENLSHSFCNKLWLHQINFSCGVYPNLSQPYIFVLVHKKLHVDFMLNNQPRCHHQHQVMTTSQLFFALVIILHSSNYCDYCPSQVKDFFLVSWSFNVGIDAFLDVPWWTLASHPSKGCTTPVMIRPLLPSQALTMFLSSIFWQNLSHYIFVIPPYSVNNKIVRMREHVVAKGRPCLLCLADFLSLVLGYTRTRGSLYALQMVFGASHSFLS